MPKAIQKLMTALAATGLLLTPIVAQANTRAGDSNAVYATASQPGLARGAQGESLGVTNDDDDDGAGKFIAWFLVGLWVTGIAVIIFDDDEPNQSPGAN